MLASYTFNTTYKPSDNGWTHYPYLQLLEGGKFTANQYVPVLISEYNQIRLKYFKWGLVAPWTKRGQEKDIKKFAPTSQLFHHPVFQLPVRRRRCLIPADSYYIEDGKKGDHTQYKVSFGEGDAFCFAGIYDTWKEKDGSIVHTFAIVTTPARGFLTQFNLQMPLILPKNLEMTWLNPYTDLNKINKITQLPSQGGMHIQRVHELKLHEKAGLEQAAA